MVDARGVFVGAGTWCRAILVCAGPLLIGPCPLLVGAGAILAFAGTEVGRY